MFTDVRRCCANISQRWIFVLMCFFALFNAFAMRDCLSTAFREMTASINNEESTAGKETETYSNIKLPNNNPTNTSSKGIYHSNEYSTNPILQSKIIRSFYWGYLLSQLPGGWLAHKYGGKFTLGFSMLLNAVFTLLTPSAVYNGDATVLMFLKFIMGLCEGTTYPAVTVLLAKWTPPEERSRTATFVYTGALIGTIYATTVSSWTLQYSNIGWPLVFYVIGTISLVWFVIWLPMCYNDPQHHPFISEKEVNYLKERMSKHTHENPATVPWRHILFSKPLWAVIIALIGFNWSMFSIISYLPMYMSEVLKFSWKNYNYVTSLVYLFVWIGGNTSAWFADYIISKKNVSTSKVRKCGSVIALPVSAAFIIIASYAGGNEVLVIGMFTMAMMLMGTAYSSIIVNLLDLSPNYAGMLMGLVNCLLTLERLISNYVIGIVIFDPILIERRTIFWILFGVSVVSNGIYLAFGSGNVEYWNDPEFVNREISDLERKRSTSEVL